MMTSAIRALTSALLLLFLSSALAESPTVSSPNGTDVASAVYRIKGIVKAISPDALTLEHEAVPALQWPAMTMPFALAKGTSLPQLALNDVVEAEVALADGRYVITALTVQR